MPATEGSQPPPEDEADHDREETADLSAPAAPAPPEKPAAPSEKPAAPAASAAPAAESGGRRRWSPFSKENQARATVISGVAALVALVGLKPTFFPDPPPNTAAADLRVVARSLQRGATVDATVTKHGDPATKGRIGTVALDVTVENRGDYPAFISAAALTFHHQTQLIDCAESGDSVKVSGTYSVAVPTSARPVPFALTEPLQFQVRPRSVDRLLITVGPEVMPGGEPAWLYNFDAALRYADGRKVLPVGTVSAVAPPVPADDPGGLLTRRKAPGDLCPERNRDLVAKVAAMPGEHTAELDALAGALRSFAPADAQPARRTCTPAPQPAASGPAPVGVAACFHYTPARLEGEISFPPGLSAAFTQTAVDIEDPGTGRRFSATVRAEPGGAVQVSCLTPALQPVDPQCWSPSTGQWTPGRLTFAVIPEAYDDDSRVVFSEAVTVTTSGRSYGATLVDYGAPPVQVVRGHP